MENLLLVHADPSHASVLAKLAVDTFCESFEKVNNPEDFWTYTNEAFHVSKIEEEIIEPGSSYIIAYVNSEIAGYARIRQSDEVDNQFPGKKTLELQRIYALGKFIGKGIGKALMNYCLDLCRKQHADIVWLGVWEHNHRAQQFYKKLGFEQFGSHVFMLGKDAQTDILMKLNIT
ncbi:MAG TPA: GNAT family N-acetyltransferase [Cyclobacteriaceae bacterium]|nr:GNAT family N-acetyltransferase [Cyclobacteriaceae bacterium]